MTNSGAQELDCSAGLGLPRPPAPARLPGAQIVGIPPDLYVAHNQKTTQAPSTIRSAEAASSSSEMRLS
jgi:arginase family enzyme